MTEKKMDQMKTTVELSFKEVSTYKKALELYIFRVQQLPDYSKSVVEECETYLNKLDDILYSFL